jgi:hypothetical protein
VGCKSALFSKKSSCNLTNFLQIAESFFQEGTGEEFEIFFVTARQIWLRRNEWIYEWVFTHPNDLILGARQKLDNSHMADQKEGGEP